MHAIEQYEIDTAAELLALAYQHDLHSQLEMEHVKGSDAFLAIRAQTYIETLFGKAAIWIEEESPKRILIAYQNKRFSPMRFVKLIRDSTDAIEAAAEKEQLDQMIQNGKKLKKLENYVWHGKLMPKKQTYYHLLTLFTEPEGMNTDVVYDMLEPFMSYCDRYGMPMTYETWDDRMEAIMKNLCFEVKKTVESRKCPGVVVRYMVREPQTEEENLQPLSEPDGGYEGETDYK